MTSSDQERRVPQVPGHLIRRAQQIAVSIFLEECASFDITPVQYAALNAVADNPGIDATRLSALIALDRSTLGSVLERMESKGLIMRIAHVDDKRVKLVQLAQKGRQLLDEVGPHVQQAQKRILEPLAPEDQETFMRMLLRLVEWNNDASRAPLKAIVER